MTAAMTLRAHDWTLVVQPELGAAVTTLAHRGNAVLQNRSQNVVTALDAACFALVPFANRIAEGQLEHAGRQWSISRAPAAHPHALHGVGWLAQWQVTEWMTDQLALEHVHDGGPAWPWPYVARQHIKIDSVGVSFVLGIVNRAEETVPVGLGFHPAFPVAADTRLQATVGKVWLVDGHLLPTVRAAADHFSDWQSGAIIRRESLVDNCHEGWQHQFAVVTGSRTTLVSASPGLDWLHIYVPPGSDTFCAEPVSHMPDGFNRAAIETITGTRLLEPGQQFEVWMRIQLQANGPTQ
jgi:aldose 1-epimerase